MLCRLIGHPLGKDPSQMPQPDHMVAVFLAFARNFCTDFQCFPKLLQCIRASLSPHSHQHLYAKFMVIAPSIVCCSGDIVLGSLRY